MATREQVAAVKAKYSAELRKQNGVAGVGVEKDADNCYVLTVHVNANAVGVQLPDEIEGCPVKVIRSGPFRKFSD
jgi:hypothetical protein